MACRVASLCLVLALLAGCGAASGAPVFPAASGARSGHPGAERPAVQALDLLRRWDGRRAAAYAAGDPRRLRRLYAPGSRAGARDVDILRSYADRGLVVVGLTVQVLEVRLVSASPRSARLRVLDRVAGARVVPAAGAASGSAAGSTAGSGAGERDEASLPSGRPVSRVVTMVDLGRGWVVRSVRRG